MKCPLPVLIISIIILTGLGCSSLQLGQKASTKTYYVLHDPGPGRKTTYRQRPISLLIGETTASSLVSSRKIVFSRTPDTRSFYQYASWAETPPRVFTRLLLNRLEAARLFTAVYRRPTVVHTDLQLSIELTEFYHDARKRPGTARIRIRIQLFDNRGKRTIEQRSFAREVAVPSYDAKGAVQGFSQAVGLILDDVVDGLDKVTMAGENKKGT